MVSFSFVWVQSTSPQRLTAHHYPSKPLSKYFLFSLPKSNVFPRGVFQYNRCSVVRLPTAFATLLFNLGLLLCSGRIIYIDSKDPQSTVDSVPYSARSEVFLEVSTFPYYHGHSNLTPLWCQRSMGGISLLADYVIALLPQTVVGGVSRPANRGTMDRLLSVSQNAEFSKTPKHMHKCVPNRYEILLWMVVCCIF